MTWVGVDYRPQLACWIESFPPELECLEITAYKGGEKQLCSFSKQYPLMIRGRRLSVGTPGPLNPDELDWFTSIVLQANPRWISTYLGFSRTDEFDLVYSNPVCTNRETLSTVVDHAREIMERCRKPLILENIASHLQIKGTMSETDFMNRLCEEAGCGLLLNATNLFVNSKNHRFSPRSWLRDIEEHRIVQLHVGAYSYHDDRFYSDRRDRIQEDLWEFIEEVLSYFSPRAAVLERDGNFPRVSELASELHRLKAAVPGKL